MSEYDLDSGGPLPPGWTLTGLPPSMTHAFRQRAVHRVATRFIPMLKHRRNLRLKRSTAQSKIRVGHKEISDALRATGSPLLASDSVVEACIEHGALSLHSPGEIVIYAGETCAPSAWFLLRGRLDSFQASVSWHSPNLSERPFPQFDKMSRLSYVYRPVGVSSSSATAASAAALPSSGGAASKQQQSGEDNLASTTTSLSTQQGAAATTVTFAPSAPTGPAIPGETRYTCTTKGGMSRLLHGRRGGSDVRGPRALADVATLCSYRFTSFFAVPYDATEEALVLRVPRHRVDDIFSRVLSHEQREQLLRRVTAFREAEMVKVFPLHPLQIHESWLFRGIGHDVLRALSGGGGGSSSSSGSGSSSSVVGINSSSSSSSASAATAIPFPLVAGQTVAARGRRLAHILFVQRGLVALKDDKGEVKLILGPGSVYGEREALFRERLTVSVVALTNADVLALSLKTIKHTCQVHHGGGDDHHHHHHHHYGGGSRGGGGSSSSHPHLTAQQILNRNAAQRRQRDLHASFEASGGRLAESVKRTPLIPAHLAESLLPLLKPRVFSAGAHIVDSTSECDRIVYLTRGCAAVRGLRDDVSGGEVLFQRGECVGFTCMVAHRWQRTIIAAEPVDTWELPRALLHRWLKQHTGPESEGKVPDLFNKVVGATMQLLQPFYVFPNLPRDPALEQHVMNPHLHYGEDIAVRRAREKSSHGFVKLGDGAAAAAEDGGEEQQQQHQQRGMAMPTSSSSLSQQQQQQQQNEDGSFDETADPSPDGTLSMFVPGRDAWDPSSNNGPVDGGSGGDRPRKNTLPWLETPNLHPTSFEVSEAKFRPWLPPLRASVVSQLQQQYHQRQQPSALSSKQGQRGMKPNREYIHQFDSDSDNEHHHHWCSSDDDDLNNNNCSDPHGHVNNVFERWRQEQLEIQAEEEEDRRLGTAAARAFGEEDEHEDDREGGGGGGGGDASPGRRRKNRRHRHRHHHRGHSDENDAEGSSNNKNQQNDALARPPMGTFAPGPGSYGDHTTDAFGTLTSHTYTFTPATQFEKSGLFQRRMQMIRQQQQQQQQLLQQQGGGGHHLSPGARRRLAAAAASADDDYDPFGDLDDEEPAFGVDDVVVEEDFVDLLDPGRAAARQRWDIVRDRAGAARAAEGKDRHDNANRALAALNVAVRGALGVGASQQQQRSSSSGGGGGGVSPTSSSTYYLQSSSPSGRSLKSGAGGGGGHHRSPHQASAILDQCDQAEVHHAGRVDKTDWGIKRLEKDSPALKEMPSAHVQRRRGSVGVDDSSVRGSSPSSAVHLRLHQEGKQQPRGLSRSRRLSVEHSAEFVMEASFNSGTGSGISPMSSNLMTPHPPTSPQQPQPSTVTSMPKALRRRHERELNKHNNVNDNNNGEKNFFDDDDDDEQDELSDAEYHRLLAEHEAAVAEERRKHEYLARARASRGERRAAMQEKIEQQRDQRMRHWMGHRRDQETATPRPGSRLSSSACGSSAALNMSSSTPRQRSTARGLPVEQLENEWEQRGNFTCLSGHATSASEMNGSLLSRWRSGAEQAQQQEAKARRKEQKSILLQPRRPYQPPQSSVQIIAAAALAAAAAAANDANRDDVEAEKEKSSKRRKTRKAANKGDEHHLKQSSFVEDDEEFLLS